MVKLQYDVAVVAGGPAGLAAAISAAENGAKVALFEKAANTGGAASMGMGPFAVESRLQKMVMDDMTKEQAFRQYMTDNDWNVPAKIIRDYFWRSADTIDWLMGMGVQFVAAMKNFPTSKATWHVVMPEGGGRPGARCASAMTRKMHARAVELGVEVYLNTPVVDLKKDGEEVVGLIAKNADGTEYDVDAKATILCTGGFGSDPQLIQENGYTLFKDMFTFMIPGITGDGLRMAWKAGVGKGRMMMEKIVGHGLPTAMTGEAINFLCFTQGSPIAINKAGERVCDESVMQNMAIGANIIDYQQDRTVFKVLDDQMIRYFRKHGVEFPSEVFPGDPTEGFEEAWPQTAEQFPQWAFAADSLEELAEKMGVDPENLVATVERYNEMCENNYDEDYGKDRRYMRALTGKKFYAYKLTISAYGSLGGIKINSNYETVTEDGKVVKGLYAAGSDTCEIYNGTYYYNFPGNSMGYAINSGRFAGENAAAYAVAEEEEEWD